MMKYHQLTLEERVLISHLSKQGLNPSQIGREIGRHRGIITREIARNRCNGIDSCYRYSRAHRRAVARRRRSRRNRHYTERDFAIVRRFLRKDYSPEQIVGIIRRFKLMKRRMSHETIYTVYLAGQKGRRPAVAPSAPIAKTAQKALQRLR